MGFVYRAKKTPQEHDPGPPRKTCNIPPSHSAGRTPSFWSISPNTKTFHTLQEKTYYSLSCTTSQPDNPYNHLDAKFQPSALFNSLSFIAICDTISKRRFSKPRLENHFTRRQFQEQGCLPETLTTPFKSLAGESPSAILEPVIVLVPQRKQTSKVITKHSKGIAIFACLDQYGNFPLLIFKD